MKQHSIRFGAIAALLVLLLTACGAANSLTNVSADFLSSPASAQASSFVLTSPDVDITNAMPEKYTCDGESATLPLTWSGAPTETASYALLMHHIASPQDIHSYWVLYNIPTNVTNLSINAQGVGTLGINSVNGQQAYTPPCSQGPGLKEYILTIYALSAEPQFSVPASQVDRDALLTAIQNITLDSAELRVTYNFVNGHSQNSQASQTPARANAPDAQGQGGGTPPQEAVTACSGKAAQASCTFTSPRGNESGVCEMVQNVMACSPQRGPNEQNKNAPNGSAPNTNQNSQNGSAPNANQNPQASQTPARANAPGAQGQGGGTPPQEAVTACSGKAAQASCTFTSPRGNESGVCEMVQNVMACSPQRGPNEQNKNAPNGSAPNGNPNSQNGNAPGANGSSYNIEQAISDKAQGMTIAYDAFAFLTGDLGSDSFFPPGKVADFWGFQYLRDNDSSQMGHAGDFLTSAAMNMLNILTTEQRAQLVTLAKNQVGSINEYGYKRFVLMDAFRRQIQNKQPSGTTGLSADAVKAYSSELYRLDGEISYARAETMGKLLYSMTPAQKASLDAMVGKGMREWNQVQEPADIQGLDRDVKVAVMTYAADMFSWYAGSLDADVYFCPERHGTYFGSFYLKDIHAMSDSTYAIPTNITGDMGETMLQTLNANQAQLITSLVDIQKPSLQGIVETRRAIATELRKFKDGGAADRATVLALMEKYGAYDGEIIYQLATHFTQVSQSLTSEQKAKLLAMRQESLGDLMYPSGAYLYSQPIAMPQIPNTDFLFK